MNIQVYNKAIVAALGLLVTILAPFVSMDWASPLLVQSIGGLVTTFLVLRIPNAGE